MTHQPTTHPPATAESRGRCGRCGRHEPHSHPELWGKEKMPPGGEDFKVERATTSAARLTAGQLAALARYLAYDLRARDGDLRLARDLTACAPPRSIVQETPR